MNVYSITCHRNTQKLSLGSCDIFPKELNQIFNNLIMNQKLTKEKFIKLSIERYGEKYDLSEVEYIDKNINIKIFCNNCKKYFFITPIKFLNGFECECTYKNPNSRSMYSNLWIEKASKKFGEVCDYTDSIYVKDRQKILIYCKVHEDYFLQRPSTHLNSKYGCPIRAKKLVGKQFKSSVNVFIEKARQIHGNLYDYSFVNYIDNQTKVKILDNETGDIFWQTPNSHLTGSGNPKRKRSSGEMLIQKLLKDFNIDFKEEYVLKNIIQGRNIKNIRIDFRLLNLSKEIWIEYNGIQHYKYINNFFKETIDDYQKQLTRDKNVRDYCKEHDILLIEIPYTYTKYEILKPILEDILFSGKSPEDIIIYPEIEMYTKFFKT